MMFWKRSGCLIRFSIDAECTLRVYSEKSLALYIFSVLLSFLWCEKNSTHTQISNLKDSNFQAVRTCCTFPTPESVWFNFEMAGHCACLAMVSFCLLFVSIIVIDFSSTTQLPRTDQNLGLKDERHTTS